MSCPNGAKFVGGLLIIFGLGGIGLGVQHKNKEQTGLGIVGVVVGIILLLC